MAYSAWRLAAATCLFFGLLPPWIQGIVLVPLGLWFYSKAKDNENEDERKVEALEQLADSENNS